jgi:thymidylate synthase (FAD)
MNPEYVQLLDVMGNDLTVVNAARVSFAKESTEMTDKDEKLIAYLARHHHVTPFFHPQIRFRIKMPIFVAREWYRHQIGFARNEVSRRYVDTPPEFFVPSMSDIRERDSNLKQGSMNTAIPNSENAYMAISNATAYANGVYQNLLNANVAPEIARMVLPQNMMTEFIETGSLAAYARLCKLRLDPHAQKEIRDYAGQISEELERRFPVSWKALMSA